MANRDALIIVFGLLGVGALIGVGADEGVRRVTEKPDSYYFVPAADGIGVVPVPTDEDTEPFPFPPAEPMPTYSFKEREGAVMPTETPEPIKTPESRFITNEEWAEIIRIVKEKHEKQK